MMMNQNVKPINHFEAPPANVSIGTVVLFATFVILSAIGWFGAFAGVLRPLLAAFILTVSVVPAGMGIYRVIAKGEARGRETQARYFDYLSTLSIATLTVARRSPELDKDSHRAMTAFLNERHPGWSYDAAEPC
jgi:hypothetical protein